MKIGAQRLYTAIKNNTPAIVTLFLTSENTTRFSYQKVFELWRDEGCDPKMLETLIQHPEFQHWQRRGYHRRHKQNFANDEFAFSREVLKQLDTMTNSKEYTVENLLKIIELTKILVATKDGEHNLNGSGLARNLIGHIDEGIDWPFSIAAVSRGIGFSVVGHKYDKQDTINQVIDWFLDMHGLVTDQDIQNYKSNLNFAYEKRYEDLARLVPDDGTRNLILQQDGYQYKEYIEQLINKHKEYKRLIAIAPWLEVRDEI